MRSIRPPAIAGTFYPFPRQVLESEVNAMLDVAKPAIRTVAPKAIIVPHAGYIYSGPTAAIAESSIAFTSLSNTCLGKG